MGVVKENTSGLAAASEADKLAAKPGAWVEIGLTLPIFLFYHLGVIFLGIQNATDFLTRGILRAADGNTTRYIGITVAIAAIFAAIFAIGGRGQGFAPRKFLQISVEGIVYAILMRLAAGYLVTRVFAGPPLPKDDRFTGMVMALGAGFYEELAFRVILFGLGLKALDLDDKFIAYLKERAAKHARGSQLEVRQTTPESANLHEAEADVILSVDVYHHIENRTEYFRRLKPALRGPQALLMIIDFKDGDIAVGPPAHIKIPTATITSELTAAGYSVTTDNKTLPYQAIFLAKPVN